MSRLTRASTLALLLTVTLAAGRAIAENEGQEDLDRATEAKLIAKTLSDLDEVIRLCESALEKGLDEGNTEFAKRLLASTLTQRGRERAKRLARVSPQDPKLPEYRKAALDDFEKAVEVDPKLAQAFLFIAQLNRLSGGDAARAAEALDRAIELAADEPDLRAKALVLRATGEKDPEKRMTDLDEAVRVSPGNAAALHLRGLLRADLGKLELAMADFDRVIELAPKHVPTHEAKAVVLGRLKKYDEALVSLDKVRELSPDSVRPLVQKAHIHALQENLDAALIDLDLALSIDPDNVDVLLVRAEVYRKRGEKEKALADVERVLKLQPELPAAMWTRAILLADADKVDEAMAELEKLRRLNPKDVLILMQLGMFYNAKKKHDQAVEAYSTVLAEHPKNWMALRGRGDSLLNSGKHAEALDDYEKALTLEPKDPGLLNNLAWLLATSPEDKLRDGERAVKLAGEACELTGHKQPHILSTLAAAYAEMGDFESAIKWAERGIELANEEQKEPLGKELESYRAEKPWRELLSEGEPTPEGSDR